MVLVGYKKISIIIFLRKFIDVKFINVFCYIFVQKFILDLDILCQLFYKYLGKEII